jgi:hypothetical protein
MNEAKTTRCCSFGFFIKKTNNLRRVFFTLSSNLFIPKSRFLCPSKSCFTNKKESIHVVFDVADFLAQSDFSKKKPYYIAKCGGGFVVRTSGERI